MGRGREQTNLGGAPPKLTQRQITEQAGLSKAQQVQAVRPATSAERPQRLLND
jgi:hypothetical protein